jgi:hypothetical protein
VTSSRKNRKLQGKHKKNRRDKRKDKKTRDKDNLTDRAECQSTSMTHHNTEETQVE